MNTEPHQHSPSRTASLLRFSTAVSSLLASLQGLAWLALVLVLLAAVSVRLGRLVPRPVPAPAGPVRGEVPGRIPWEKVDAETAHALRLAAERARTVAERELDVWIGELETRIDEDFLPWHFSYWQNQLRGLNTLRYMSAYLWDRLLGRSDPTGVAESLARNIGREFAARVLHPRAAQLRVERIARTAMTVYAETLDARLGEIALTYDIPQPVWDRYLEGLTWTVTDVSTGRRVPVSVKTLIAVPATGAATVTVTPTGSEDNPYSVLDLTESTFTRVDAPVIVHFNARYLMQALNAGFRSAEINDPFSPVRFTGLDGALHVLMPLRDTDTSRVLQCVGIITPVDSPGEEHSHEQEETDPAMTTTTEPIHSSSTSEPGADAQTAQGTAGTPGQDETKQDLMETFQDLLTEAQERVRDAEKAVRELKRTAKDLQRHYRDREKEIRSRERDVAKNVKLIERLQEAVAA